MAEEIGVEQKTSTCKWCGWPIVQITWDLSGVGAWMHEINRNFQTYCPGSKLAEPVDD